MRPARRRTPMLQRVQPRASDVLHTSVENQKHLHAQTELDTIIFEKNYYSPRELQVLVRPGAEVVEGRKSSARRNAGLSGPCSDRHRRWRRRDRPGEHGRFQPMDEQWCECAATSVSIQPLVVQGERGGGRGVRARGRASGAPPTTRGLSATADLCPAAGAGGRSE